jgi:hypothetical protein
MSFATKVIRSSLFKRGRTRVLLQRECDDRPFLDWGESWHLFYSKFTIVGPAYAVEQVADLINFWQSYEDDL